MKKFNISMYVALLLIASYSSKCLADDCASHYCDPMQPHAYKVCGYDMELEDVCLPPPGYDPASDGGELLPHNHGRLMRVEGLPICFDESRGLPDFFIGYGTETGDHFTSTVRIGPQNISDLRTAANEWNCICGYDNNNGKDCQTKVRCEFTDDWRNFADPYKDPGATWGRDAGEGCYGIESICVYFNNTSEFRDCIPSRGNDKKPTENVYRFIMNDSLIHDYKSESAGGGGMLGTSHYVGLVMHFASKKQPIAIYNFVEVAMREMGKVLGLGYNKDCACGNFDLLGPNMPMKANGNSSGPRAYHGVSECTKCAFQALYCPETMSIESTEAEAQKIYPNPGNSLVTLDFNIPQACSNVKISIMNSLGQLVLAPIDNMSYEAGAHSELINVDSLSIGHYTVIIEAGAHRAAQSLVIVK